jgi:hypothetical protein
MRSLFFVLQITLITLAIVIVAGCDSSTNSPSDTESVSYLRDTANVDYKGKNNVVFYDFSTGTRTIRSHDGWDLAFDTNRSVIANSGEYGYCVLVCSTGIDSIGMDFSSWKDSLDLSVDDGWFRLLSEESNPLGLNYRQGSGMGSTYTNNVYLIRTEDQRFYKVQITGSLPMGAGLRMRIDSLDGNGAVENTFETNSAYDYVYLDLETKSTVDFAPKKDAWDIKFGRTGEFIMDAMTSGRSSISINKTGGVQTAIVDAEDLSDVTGVLDCTFSDDLLTIGHNWYSYNRTDKIYELAQKVYIFETTEGNYAKMKIYTFKGPNDENFWADFDYHYQADGATAFSK